MFLKEPKKHAEHPLLLASPVYPTLQLQFDIDPDCAAEAEKGAQEMHDASLVAPS